MHWTLGNLEFSCQPLKTMDNVRVSPGENKGPVAMFQWRAFFSRSLPISVSEEANQTFASCEVDDNSNITQQKNKINTKYRKRGGIPKTQKMSTWRDNGILELCLISSDAECVVNKSTWFFLRQNLYVMSRLTPTISCCIVDIWHSPESISELGFSPCSPPRLLPPTLLQGPAVAAAVDGPFGGNQVQARRPTSSPWLTLLKF